MGKFIKYFLFRSGKKKHLIVFTPGHSLQWGYQNLNYARPTQLAFLLTPEELGLQSAPSFPFPVISDARHATSGKALDLIVSPVKQKQDP